MHKRSYPSTILSSSGDNPDIIPEVEWGNSYIFIFYHDSQHVKYVRLCTPLPQGIHSSQSQHSKKPRFLF